MARTFLKTAAIAAAAAIAGPAVAQDDYPARPITMLGAYSPGGGTDVAARTLVPFIEKYLDGADINVVNRPGAGGEVGFTALANAETDGYTIGFINTPNVLTIPIERDTRYAIEDFQPVGNIVDDPGTFAVLPDSEFQSLEELAAYAEENPGEVTYGSTGIGSDDHLAGLTFERQTGVTMQHVPFGGSADVRAALLGGHIDLAIINIGEAIKEDEAGRMRVLGQMAEERWEGAPDVPTFREQGFDIVSGSQRGIAVPAGVDPAIVQKVAAAIEQAVKDPAFREKAAEQALPLRYLGPDEYAALLQASNENAREIWAENPWASN